MVILLQGTEKKVFSLTCIIQGHTPRCYGSLATLKYASFQMTILNESDLVQ